MYKLAVFDIDGTLAVEGNLVPETALAALEKLKGNGVECLIATGRERENLHIILEITGIENYVACNGHYVKFQEETLYRYTYPEDVIEEIRKTCKKDGNYYGFSNGKGIFISKFEKLKEEFSHPMLEKVKLLEKII